MEDYESTKHELEESTEPLLLASETPNIPQLITELQRSYMFGANTTALNENDDLRYCRWDGQTTDGKKFSENRDEDDPALPFEGASDSRIRLIDRVINEQVSLWMNALKGAKLAVSGRTAEDSKNASSMSTLLEYVTTGRMRQEMRREAELWANYVCQYGWSAVHIGWEQEMGTREQRFTISDLVNMASEAYKANPDSPLSSIPTLILDPQKDELTATLIMNFLPNHPEKEVRKMIVDMREKGYATVYDEVLLKSLPVVTTLKPYDEITFPPETIDLQKARVVFRKLFMTELEIRSMIGTDNWDEEGVEEACKTKGMFTWYRDPNITPTNSLAKDYRLRTNNLIEICYAYYKQLSEDGTPCVYYTAFSPHSSSDTYLKHEKLGYAHGKYPFVVLRREYIRKAIYESRGITDILSTDQAELKAQRDAMRDRTAFETVPPLMYKRRVGGTGRIGPAMLLPVSDVNADYKWMEPPKGSPQIAEFVVNQIEKEAAGYFGLTREESPPALAQMLQQNSVDNWLTAWSEAYTQMLQLTLQYMDVVEIERICGSVLPRMSDDITNMYDFEVKFDVRNLYSDLVLEKLQAINQYILPQDTGGIIDRNAMVKLSVEAVSSDIAKAVITDQASASQKLYRDVQTEIGMMMLGNEANYVENDPTAQTKMMYLQDIMSKNIKAQQASQSDQMFSALLQNYIKNLQMSVMQQQNKQIGRIGVSPVADKLKEQTQQSQINLNNAKTQYYQGRVNQQGENEGY
mgnify:CR=1 FL=1